jgi:hypothetical protein
VAATFRFNVDGDTLHIGGNRRWCDPERSDAGDICGEEVDAVSVEVAASVIVVLGGSGVGVAGEDLGVAKGDAGVEGVGDGSYPPES